MSYPPKNAKRPIELGTVAPAKRRVIDRRINPDVTATSLSTTDRTNRAIHTSLNTADELWDVISQAAKAASAHPTTCACKTLWLHLDPPLAGKSAPVKAAVQALCLDLLLAPVKQQQQAKLTKTLVDWFALARQVAVGAHALFVQGVNGWDDGLDLGTHKVLLDKNDQPLVFKSSYWPFENYNRTLCNPLYANCFGDSEAQSMRSRVCLVDPDGKAAAKWRVAKEAHKKMLDVEAHNELFLPRDAHNKDGLGGLSAAELGGLFLLTNLSDNWAKRISLFDLDFWTLRIVHFGLERNLGLRMNQFNIDALTTAANGLSPQMQPSDLLRNSHPDPKRSRCWLENSIDCIVALKVHLFLKMRWSLYDEANPKSEQVLNNLVLLDRHDIEQSKAHWLPSARPKSLEASPLAIKPAPDPIDLPPLAPLPTLPPPETPLHEALLARLCENGTPVSGRAALAMLASERFLLLQRVDVLDRIVGMHCEVQRLLADEHQKQSEVAIEHLNVITVAMDAPDLPEAEAARLAASFQAISSGFTLRSSAAAALEGVKKRVQTRGLQLRAADRVWVVHADGEAVAKLVAVGVPGPLVLGTDVHTTLGPDEDFDALFGVAGSNGTLSSARCAPRDGWCRVEACALIDRLVHLLASEATLHRRLRSLDVLVPVPLACRSEVALTHVSLGMPQRAVHKSLRIYTQLHKKDADRGSSLRIMAGTCASAMAKAMERAFTACLAECSDVAESDVEFGDAGHERAAAQLKMPERLYACQRKVGSSVVHCILNIAQLHGALHVVSDNDLPEEEDEWSCPPVLVYNVSTARLSMPNPMAIVERHWSVAQHIIDLAVAIEPWVRDKRRRLPCLLEPDEYLVTLSPTKGISVHAERRAAARARLDAAEDEQRQRYWPAWPPTEFDLVTSARLSTALKWGRHATLHALRGTAPRQVMPAEPYRSTLPARVNGPHEWLHRAHFKYAPKVVS